MRLGFIAWYSNDEDVLRYHGVKNNYFAREADLPARKSFEAPIPTTPTCSRVSSRARPMVQRSRCRECWPPRASWPRCSIAGRCTGSIRAVHGRTAGVLHRQFGADRDEVSDLENVYLKLAEVFYLAKPQSAMDVIRCLSRSVSRRGRLDRRNRRRCVPGSGRRPPARTLDGKP